MSSARKFIVSITRFSSSYHASRILWSNTEVLRHHGLTQSLGHRYLSNYTRTQNFDTHRRRFLAHSVVQPGAPPPSEPTFKFINWIVGVAITIVLPFFSHKWASLLKIKSEVETAVEIAEEIVEVVEKVAEGVEKAAEDIAEDLPEGGGLRKAVDFVEHVAARANKGAHIVGDFIDKVQEVEEKVEEYVESLAGEATTHKHHEEEENRAHKEEEDRAPKPPKEKILTHTNIIRY